ncbi:MAG: guanitoxin biosynthesis heme-dependent pre-guanitoxin N-hydroxylase GntA [Hyphomonas sp.]|nr:guanitoxin biosynthesis heme-dependent pre-guanitoxin N-hydroxylase GntA [Hyphomonas sp.]
MGSPTLSRTQAFEQFVKSESFPCIGAKSAMVRDQLVIAEFGDINSAAGDISLRRALGQFVEDLDFDSPVVQSFVAIFSGPNDLSETDFELALWNRLQSLHNLDVVEGRGWAESAARDPESAHFSMGLLGEAFFVIGLHPNASRPARRFEFPALVFNSHEQFERLREDGRFEKMKQIIRTRDQALAGSVNPMLADFGRESEAAQYSGREVGPDWKCPFAPQEPAE